MVKELTVFNPKVCCNHSFKKPNNLKEIYNVWDVFIDWSLKLGNSHIAITINIPNNKEYQEDPWLCEFKDVLKMHPISKDSEEYDEYIRLKHSLFYDQSLMDSYFAKISAYNKLITWQFLTTEENKQG